MSRFIIQTILGMMINFGKHKLGFVFSSEEHFIV